jgi:hypothetical protein
MVDYLSFVSSQSVRLFRLYFFSTLLRLPLRLLFLPFLTLFSGLLLFFSEN